MDAEMRALADRVRTERKRRHWNQRDLADAAGVKEGMIGLFERKRTTPQPANLRGILRALDMETEGGDDEAAASREEWPADVRVFLDVIGIYLTEMAESDRPRVMAEVTRQIVSQSQR